jgi:hypothetical protein
MTDGITLCARSGTLPNTTGMFPQLRALNGSHNAFSGPLPAGLGQTGIFRLSPLQFVNGEILMHVLDLSYNQLNGSLPSFLDASSVPAQYVQKGVFLQARRAPPRAAGRSRRRSCSCACAATRVGFLWTALCASRSGQRSEVCWFVCKARRAWHVFACEHTGCRPAGECGHSWSFQAKHHARPQGVRGGTRALA